MGYTFLWMVFGLVKLDYYRVGGGTRAHELRAGSVGPSSQSYNGVREEAKSESVTRRPSLASSRAYFPQQAADLIRVVLGVLIKLICDWNERHREASPYKLAGHLYSASTLISGISMPWRLRTA